jgi:hypothetical protein
MSLPNYRSEPRLDSTQGLPEVELLSLRCEAEAAKFLGSTPRTLQNWRATGGGPQYIKSGRSVRYRLKDLIDYVESRVRNHTAQQTGGGS